jgi:lysophospholipase L1-like esterase
VKNTARRLFPILLLAMGLVLSSQAQNAAMPAAKDDPRQPIPKAGNARFFELHESFLSRGKSGPIDLLFLGDSITEGWKKAPHIWEQYYGKYQPANFGISGDRTQHVIWRIANGELDGISPKVVVLMLGTNNTGADTAEEIAAADRTIVAMIQEKLPETKILVLGIFPRGPRWGRNGNPDNWEEKMTIIRAVNDDLAGLDNGSTIRYLNITRAFLGNDGSIPNILMPDQLHPNAAGYQLWAEAMDPLLTEMMQ